MKLPRTAKSAALLLVLGTPVSYCVGQTPTPAKPKSSAAANPAVATPAASTPKAESKEPTAGKYALRHKLKAGDVIRTEVTHQAKTITRIQGTDQISVARTVSEKVWNVLSVDDKGNAQVEYRVDRVNMSQQSGTDPEIKYNSATDSKAPAIYTRVAETLGKPIGTVTISPRGEILERSGKKDAPTLGMGDVALVFPLDPVAIGGEWSIPHETRVKTDEQYKTIKIRETYTLKSVSAGVATILVRSEPLTPLATAEIEAQVMQQLNNGTLRFDLDAGRLISKELKWDDSVIGFKGAESQINYAARLTEEAIANSTSKTASLQPVRK